MKWAVGGAGLVLGIGLGLALAPPAAAPAPNPALRTLDANLYVQTSPEYRALCLQSYNIATERVAERVKGVAKPAVVMDLDETVFDNSPFQTWLYRNAATFTQERWTPWERDKGGEVLAVPGAVEFIAAAEKAGATVFFISNRGDEYRDGAKAALAHLGVNLAWIDERLLLKAGKSDKTERRKKVAERHTVVMLVGDTLTDFTEDFALGEVPDGAAGRKALIAARKARVDAARGKWGVEWVVLPNPCYGDFTKVAGGNPLAVMNPTTLPGR